MQIISFPIIRSNDWSFKVSLAGKKIFMLFAFGPSDEFLIRYYTNEEDSRAFIDECSMEKHVD